MQFASAFEDQDEASVAIKAGDFILWHETDQSISIFRGEGTQRTDLRWKGGDNKKLVHFLKTRDDFYEFANVIAATNGLSIRKIADRFGGPAYMFQASS